MRKPAEPRGETMKMGNGLRKIGNLFARRSRRAFGRRGEEGAALLEFAITLPLLMTVLTGTASFSLALYLLQQIGNATSTAAQLLGADVGLVSDPCNVVVKSVTGSLPNLTASKITYTVSITDNTGTVHTTPATTGSSFSCTSYASYMYANYPVTVTVSYAYSWLPILGFSPSSGLSSSETALQE
jgi:Flp pilus assembly protein TadG